MVLRLLNHKTTTKTIMNHNTWQTTKPNFTDECLLIVATYFSHSNEYDYSLYQVRQLDGENEQGEYAWYWGLLEGDGDEWGPLEDLKADLYMTMPLLIGEPKAKTERRNDDER